MTPHTHRLDSNSTREFTHKGRSDVVINVGSQYLNFVYVIGGLPMKPVRCKSAVGV
jgi:hypothetical protein